MNTSTWLRLKQTLAGLAICALSLGTDCGNDACDKPGKDTGCASVCKNAGSCKACWGKVPDKNASWRTNCKNNCNIAHQELISRAELAAGSDPPSVPCGCEEETATCEDSVTAEIFAELPSYMDCEELRYFVCSLNNDERAQLLADIKDNSDKIDDTTYAEFTILKGECTDIVNDLLQANNLSGHNAYLFMYGNFLHGIWYEWMGEL